MAAVDAGVLAELLKVQPPFEVLSSVTDNQVAFWLADGLVIDDANLVARILRDQLQVTESDFYRCVQREELPPRPSPTSTLPPPDTLDAKLVRNLVAKVGMSQSQTAFVTKEEATAAWQEYLTGGGSARDIINQ